jgi:UV DNA damage repair endonuclease
MNCYNNGNYGETTDRFETVYHNMSDGVRSRLVLENEDKHKSWSVMALYENTFKRLGIPITFDNLHHLCNPNATSEEEAFETALSTWPKDVVPLFHFSESLLGKIRVLTLIFLQCCLLFMPTTKATCTSDFEFKMKEIAINKISRESLLTLCE